jgi:hypothetical protein
MSAFDVDDLVPDPQVRREFHITPMTLWRWDHDPELNFPPPVRIRKRKFRSRSGLDNFKQRLLQEAVDAAAEDKTSRKPVAKPTTVEEVAVAKAAKSKPTKSAKTSGNDAKLKVDE